MALPKFAVAKNLVDPHLVEGAPWDFTVPDEANALKRMPKAKRRLELLKSSTAWSVYSSVIGVAPGLRVSKSNPAKLLRGLVVDYDMVSVPDTVVAYVNQMAAQNQPAFFETSLGGKARLVWLFERPILVPSTEFCQELIKTFLDKLGAPTLLPGYDPASTKPTEMWTNGGTWMTLAEDGSQPNVLSWEFCFGVVCEVSKKTSLFANGEIPLTAIAEEVQKRWPGRWPGDFQIDAQGVRFWDPKADNSTGCQVKPDGMLCFTGNEPFVKWEQLFGRQWCEEQRILNLGRAGKDIFFDRRNYWELANGVWKTFSRVDVLLRLTGRGLSDRTPKGATQSDAARVLDHIQQVNCIDGAAPLINYPIGLVDLAGRRILNTADLAPVLPVAGPTGDPEKDFPWLWKFHHGFFRHPELLPLDHALTWLRRGYSGILGHKRYMGQSVFVCGPRNNGKTLWALHVVAPLLGNRVANPLAYFKGETDFNAELFRASLLCVNDDTAPGSDAERRKMAAKIKGLVVNPQHKYHAKFENPITIDWQGRILITLNDDAGSVGMLTEIESNTRDKNMFFASQSFKGVFPPQDELEAIIARELPYFAHWLLNVYQPPASVLADDRMGVQSYFDPHILELSNSQTYASNLKELLEVWMDSDGYWMDEQNSGRWTGTPTSLLSCLQTCAACAGMARDWKQQAVAKSLVGLAKQEGSGVTFGEGGGRTFIITRATQGKSK